MKIVFFMLFAFCLPASAGQFAVHADTAEQAQQPSPTQSPTELTIDDIPTSALKPIDTSGLISVSAKPVAVSHIIYVGTKPTNIGLAKKETSWWHKTEDENIKSVLDSVVPKDYSTFVSDLQIMGRPVETVSDSEDWDRDIEDAIYGKGRDLNGDISVTIDWKRKMVILRLNKKPVELPEAKLPPVQVVQVVPPVVVAAKVLTPAEIAAAEAAAKAKEAAETWMLVGGHTIGADLESWGDRAGWRVIWTLSKDWTVPASSKFTGDFQAAATSVIKTLATNGALIHAQFFNGNKTMLISGPGVSE